MSRTLCSPTSALLTDLAKISRLAFLCSHLADGGGRRHGRWGGDTCRHGHGWHRDAHRHSRRDRRQLCALRNRRRLLCRSLPAEGLIPGCATAKRGTNAGDASSNESDRVNERANAHGHEHALRTWPVARRGRAAFLTIQAPALSPPLTFFVVSFSAEQSRSFRSAPSNACARKRS